MDETRYAELKTYLRRLGWALSSLPERDRDDIVEETRVHVLARVEQGQGLTETLASFGPADVYAARFVDEMEITRALGSQKPLQVLGVVLRRAHKSLAATLAFLFVLFFGAWGLGGLFAAVTKPFDPDHIGLWTSDRGAFFIGSVDGAHPHLHEILGNWIYPAAAINAVVCWFLCRLVLLWALRTLRRKA
jgi:hypothetical protein